MKDAIFRENVLQSCDVASIQSFEEPDSQGLVVSDGHFSLRSNIELEMEPYVTTMKSYFAAIAAKSEVTAVVPECIATASSRR